MSFSRADGSPFGVLEVDSKSEGEFGEHDIAFLQGAANILGMAIEQQHVSNRLMSYLQKDIPVSPHDAFHVLP